MNLLAGTLYDPAVAVSKSTAALLAMTAIDTTNLRLAFTVPQHGKVRVRLSGTLHGSAASVPQILLGVLNSSTVVGRMSPMYGIVTLAANAQAKAEADFVVSGLTQGPVNWDAAYGVESLVTSSNLKYGGPNDATTNNAFGGFVFEVWDPMPNPTNFTALSIDTPNGRVDVRAVSGTTQTAVDLGARLDTTISSRATPTNITAGTITTVGTVTTVTGLTPSNLDTTISSRLASASYTAPANSNISAIKTQTDKLTFTVANQVDANIQSVNDVTVNGDGSATPWGP